MEFTTERREAGIYIIRTIGMQRWAEDHGTWQAHGVRLDLMDGSRLLAVCKLEVSQDKAEARALAVAEEITPWVEALRKLAAVAEARSRLRMLAPLMTAAQEAERIGWELEEHVQDDLLAYATAEEIEQAKNGPALNWLGLPLAQLIAERLRGNLSVRLRKLLAAAPDVASTPMHPAWEQPPMFGEAGVSTAQTLARELLTAWTAVRDLRDPLITWAVRDAGLTRTDVQRTTSVSRSTISRLLPE